MLELTPKQLLPALEIARLAARPAIVWSGPGIGKSSIARALAAKHDLIYVDQRATTMEPPDVRGLQKIDQGRTFWCPPAVFPLASDASARPCILNIDELNTAHIQVQQALLELLLDRAINGNKIHDTCYVMAMCNRTADIAFVNQMPSSLATRAVHFRLKVWADDWFEWAFANDIDPLVIAYLKINPSRLYELDEEKVANSDIKVFPCPRSWEILSDLIKQGVGPAFIAAMAVGTVGEAAGVEFAAFSQLNAKMPNLSDIIASPAKAPIPKDASTKMLTATTLASNINKKNLGAAIVYLSRLGAEYSVYAVKSALLREPTLAATAEFGAWAVEYQDIFKS